jgi:4-hydroxy-2-oxoglutarate aldolase
MKIEGVYAPVTTPFDPVTGEVDVVGFRRNARALLEAPLAGLVLSGSTGEGLLLEDEERMRLLESVRELVGARTLLAGTGAESTRATVRLSRSAAAAGADAVLVQPPAYYRPQMTPEALREHYLAVADASPVPVLLYMVPPAYSGVELAAGLVGELSHHPNVLGIKDSTGELRTLGALVEAADPGFAVLVGNGTALYGGLEVGAVGGILAVADLAPAESAAIHRRLGGGAGGLGGALQERLAALHRVVVGALGVPGIKAALDLLGRAGGPPRSPLRPLGERDRAKVAQALRAAGLLDAAASPA